MEESGKGRESNLPQERGASPGPYSKGIGGRSCAVVAGALWGKGVIGGVGWDFKMEKVAVRRQGQVGEGAGKERRRGLGKGDRGVPGRKSEFEVALTCRWVELWELLLLFPKNNSKRMIISIVPLPPACSIQYFPTCVVVFSLRLGGRVESELKYRVVRRMPPTGKAGLEEGVDIGGVDVGEEEVVGDGEMGGVGVGENGVAAAAFAVRRLGDWEREMWVVGYKGWCEVLR